MSTILTVKDTLVECGTASLEQHRKPQPTVGRRSPTSDGKMTRVYVQCTTAVQWVPPVGALRSAVIGGKTKFKTVGTILLLGRTGSNNF